MSARGHTLQIHSSPHIASGASVDVIMRNVVLALLPVVAFAVYSFGLAAALTLLVAVFSLNRLGRGVAVKATQYYILLLLLLVRVLSQVQTDVSTHQLCWIVTTTPIIVLVAARSKADSFYFF